MKTVEQFISKWSNWWKTNKNKDEFNKAFEKELKEITEEIQKESYNQALGDVLNPSKVDMYFDEDNIRCYVLCRSIEKLQK